MLTLHPTFGVANIWIMNLIGLIRRAVAVAILLLLAGVVPALAQACDNAKTTPADDMIAACTRLIASGRASGLTLAGYYNIRGIAYASKQDYDQNSFE